MKNDTLRGLPFPACSQSRVLRLPLSSRSALSRSLSVTGKRWLACPSACPSPDLSARQVFVRWACETSVRRVVDNRRKGCYRVQGRRGSCGRYLYLKFTHPPQLDGPISGLEQACTDTPRPGHLIEEPSTCFPFEQRRLRWVDLGQDNSVTDVKIAGGAVFVSLVTFAQNPP